MSRFRTLTALAALAGALSCLPAAAQHHPFPSPLGRFSFSVLGVAGQSFLKPGRFAEVYMTVLETTMFVSRRTELGFSTNPWILFNQPATNDGRGRQRVSAFAADIMLRWFPGDLGWRVQPYGEVTEGLSYGLRRFPVGGTQANFSFNAGAGLIFFRRGGWSTQVGYRFVHFSNAHLGPNPSWSFHALLLGGRWQYP